MKKHPKTQASGKFSILMSSDFKIKPILNIVLKVTQ